MLQHSFLPTDVTFMLDPIEPVFLSVEEKERLIQSGTHYSQILSKESAPKPSYLELFEKQINRFGHELARDILSLAGLIIANKRNPVLVSLVRAGTPIGVVLKRLLNQAGYEAPHYSVSIVRDKGLDMVAMGKILDAGHKPEDIVFIDAWTGKGVIRKELSKSLKWAPDRFGKIKDELYVVYDIAGMADHAASREDRLIPTSLLNATVSGLVSRSVIGDPEGKGIHRAAELHDLKPYDRSLFFVDAMVQMAGNFTRQSMIDKGNRAMLQDTSQKKAYETMLELLSGLQAKHGISNLNMVKPGIGEASRVLLRRTPELLILKDSEDAAVQHLVELAKEKKVEIQTDLDMPIKAIAIIKDVSND